MVPEVEIDTDDVAEVDSGIGLVVDRVVLTVVELTGAEVDGPGADEEGPEEEGKGPGARVEGPEVAVLLVWSVDMTRVEEILRPIVVVLEALRWVVWVDPLEVGQLMKVQH